MPNVKKGKKGASVDADFCVVGFQQQVEKKAKKTRLWLGENKRQSWEICNDTFQLALTYSAFHQIFWTD